MNCQGLGIWLAIFFLVNIRVYCGQDMSTSIGDSIYTQHINMDRQLLRIVYHTTGFSVENRTINAVKFKNIWKTGAKIKIIGRPPFSKLEVKFTSMINKGYYFIMEVHYSEATDVSFTGIFYFYFVYFFVFFY